MALTWSINGFHYRSSVIYSFPSHRIASGTVDFNLTNPALPHALACSAYSTQMMDFFYGNMWFQCTGPDDTEASFQFDKSSGRVDLQQKWSCPKDTTPYATPPQTLL